MSSTQTDEARISSPGGHLAAVDGLRAIAALAVVVSHVAAASGLTQTAGIGAYTNRLGTFGVAVFFVISGFLLYRPYAFAHLTGREPPVAGEFVRRRLWRIFPAYWVALTALIFVVHQASVHSPKDVAQLYLLLQVYDQHTVLAGLGQAWSLCVEFSFYLLLPLIAAGVRQVGRRAHGSGTTQLMVELWSIGALVASGVLYRLWVLEVAPSWREPTGSWLTSTIDWFAIGMLFAVLSASVQAADRRLPGAVRTLADRPALSWLLGVEVYWILVQLHLPRDFTPMSGTQFMGMYVLLGVAAGFLVLPMALGTAPTDGIRRVLTSGPMQWVGVRSYSVFLWHVLWLHETSRWLGIRLFTGGFWVLLTSTIVATLGCSALSYRYIELPAMRRGRRAESHRLASPASSS
ncbi:MAG: hypothetical protein QOE35_3496 [Actinomycetota bacterium]